MAIRLLTLLLAAGLPAMGGCNVAAYLLYLIAPPEEHEKTVEAEYKGLDGHSLAIVVYADQKVQYEYPQAREHISRSIAGRFQSEQVRKKIKNLRIIEPTTVLAYQDQHISWDTMDKTELGKVFGADFVLFVTLVEFTTREPGSMSLYRGIITAEVSLYKTSLEERESRVGKRFDIRVVHPEDRPGGVSAANDLVIRRNTVWLFSGKLVKKFYKHREQIK